MKRQNPLFNLKIKKNSRVGSVIGLHNSPVKVKLYPSRTKKEWKLIDKKPFIDSDHDRVVNILDCKPLNKKRQDFNQWHHTGSRLEVEQLTAAQRFGGANIKRLKKLGAGRDRVVYQLDKDKVVKLAKNVGGLRQNESEADYYINQSGFRPKFHEKGKDYVVMEKIGKLSKENKKKFNRVNASSHVYAAFGEDKEVIERLKKEFPEQSTEEEDYFNELYNYNIAPGDISKPSSWGEKDGKVILIDAGGLNKESLRNPTVKDLKALKREWSTSHPGYSEYQKDFYENKLRGVDPEIQEWEEVNTDRKIFRDKGKKEIDIDDIEIPEESPEVLNALEEEHEEI